MNLMLKDNLRVLYQFMLNRVYVKRGMSDLQRYSLSLTLVNNVEDIVVLQE